MFSFRIMEKKSLSEFFVLNVILLVAFIGMIAVIFDLTGRFLIAHLIFFIAMVLLAFFASIGIFYNLRWGWQVITVVFSLVVLDEIVIYLFNRALGVVALVAFVSALGGLVFAFIS